MILDDNVYDGNGHNPAEYTLVFPGDSDNVAWTMDIHLDENNNPYIAFSVQKDQDQRYYYGRWDGAGWHVYEMAYAGSCLYDPRNSTVDNLREPHSDGVHSALLWLECSFYSPENCP